MKNVTFTIGAYQKLLLTLMELQFYHKTLNFWRPVYALSTLLKSFLQTFLMLREQNFTWRASSSTCALEFALKVEVGSVID